MFSLVFLSDPSLVMLSWQYIYFFLSVPLSNWQVIPPTLHIRFPTSLKYAYLKPMS